MDVHDVHRLGCRVPTGVSVHEVEWPIVHVIHVQQGMRLRTTRLLGCGLHLRKVLILLAQLITGGVAARV